MNRPDFRVAIADYARDLPLLRAVREPVFVVEQRVPIELEWDEFDPQSIHAIAFDEQGNAIGTGRLTPLRTIGRMAVLREWRGRGVGAALLETLLEKARSLGYPAIELHAQVDAIPFYEHYGFSVYGEEYDEAGIRHRNMHLDLTG